jgi:DNA-3-methyladenine glycosylase II
VQRIDTTEDVDQGLAALKLADPRLVEVIRIASGVPLRRHPVGFESLCSIIVSQQISKASADAIFGRLKAAIRPFSPARLIALGEGPLITAGLSRPKQKTFFAIAEACQNWLDLEAMCSLPAEEAITRMTVLPGIGPWTAEVYLLFCAGHPDVFPCADIALQNAVRHAFSLQDRPSAKALAAIATAWSPWRSVAARLFWAYYANMKGREGAPL